MRRHCRTRTRTRGTQVRNAYNTMVPFFAFSQFSLAWREWRFHKVSMRQAQMLVAVGEALAITRMVEGVVQVVGYRALKPAGAERPSPTTLTLGTMVAVSRDAWGEKLSWRDQQEVDKVLIWPTIGDTKAVAVRPRISDEDRRRAELLLSGGRPCRKFNPLPERHAEQVTA